MQKSEGFVWFGLNYDSWHTAGLEIDHWPLTSPHSLLEQASGHGCSNEKLPQPLEPDISVINLEEERCNGNID